MKSAHKSWFITKTKYLQIFAKTYETDFKLNFSLTFRCQRPVKVSFIQYSNSNSICCATGLSSQQNDHKSPARSHVCRMLPPSFWPHITTNLIIIQNLENIINSLLINSARVVSEAPCSVRQAVLVSPRQRYRRCWAVSLGWIKQCSPGRQELTEPGADEKPSNRISATTEAS